MNVLCFGELLFDHINDVHYLGGAPANFAGHSAKLGANTSLITAVGDDALGQRALSEITEVGIDPSFIITNSYPTGTVEVQLEDGIPVYDIAFSAWDHITIDPSRMQQLLAARYDLFYFGSLAQRTEENARCVRDLLDRLTCTETFFDVNLRQEFFSKEIFLASLAYTTVIKLNDEELPVLSQMLYDTELSPAEFYERLRTEYPVRIMLLTCGKDGAYYFAPEGSGHVIPSEVPVVDTVGAGDSFSAGFMSALARSGNVHNSVVYAVKLANHVVSSQGALPDYPQKLLDELNSLL
jgi:fructokinase